MNIKKVLRNYSMLANVSQNEALSKYTLGVLAISRVESWLREGVEPKDEPILNMLAAALVNLWASNANASSSSSGSFAAGGYSITKDSSAEINAAKTEFDRWRAECAHLLIDDGFAFYPAGRPQEDEEETQEVKSDEPTG